MSEHFDEIDAVDELEARLAAARAALAAIEIAVADGAPIAPAWIANLTAFEEARSAAAECLGLNADATARDIGLAHDNRRLLQRLADMPHAGPQESIVAPLRQRACAALAAPASSSGDAAQLVRIARLDADARAGSVNADEVAELASVPTLAAAASLASLAALPLPTKDSEAPTDAVEGPAVPSADEEPQQDCVTGGAEAHADGVGAAAVSTGAAHRADEVKRDGDLPVTAEVSDEATGHSPSATASEVQAQPASAHDAGASANANPSAPGEGRGIDPDVTETLVSKQGVADVPGGRRAEAGSSARPAPVEGVRPSGEDAVPAEGVGIVETQGPSGDVDRSEPDALARDSAGINDIAAGTVQIEAVLAVLTRLIQEGRDGLAYHVATAADLSDALRTALRAATYADAIRTGAGAAATASRLALEELATTTAEFDQTARLLALAAAVRVTCAAPHLGGTQIIEEHGMALSGFPQLAALVEAVRSTGEKGITIFEHVVGSTSDLVALDAERRSLVQRAADFTEHPPQNRFPRAADHLRDLIASSDSDVHLILSAVAADQDSAIEAVEAAVSRLSSRGAFEAVIDTPIRRRKSPNSRRRIVGDARHSLRDNLAEVVKIGEQWSGACRALVRPVQDAAWLAEPIEQLRSAAQDLESAVTPTAWAGSDDDTLLAATAARVVQSVRRAARVVLGGQPPNGPDRQPWQLLGRELLRDTEIRLSEDFTPRQPVPLERLLALASPPDWRATALARAKRGDAALAELALAEMAHDTADFERAKLDQDMARLLDDARRRLSLLQEDVSGDIAAFFLKGAIDEDDWQTLSREHESLSLAVDDLAIGDGIDDFGALKITVGEVAGLHVAAHEPQLRAASAELRLSREAEHQFDLALAAQDLATAERIVLDARRGRMPVAEQVARQPFELTFPKVADALTGSGARGTALATALLRERTLFDLPVRDEADDEYVRRAAQGLQAVDALRGSEVERREAIRQVMALIGLPTTDVGRGSVESGWWRHDVIARVADKAIVPQFGSEAGGRYRVLVMRDEDATEDRITSWLSEHGSERATLVLYDGVLSPIVRRRLADRSRRAAAMHQALVIDLAVLASVAALDYGSFEATVRLTLPFTGINPYNPYASGLVPLEMFYGRRDVREDLLSPSGQIAFIYGGRRLGKSALLRAAHRDARDQEGVRACYIDLQDNGVGERAPAAKVFELIEEEFADVLPASRRRGSEARLADRVKQLASDPDAPRLLVLLDEADRLIDVDSEDQFRTLSALRRMRDETGGQVRFVFAGLHSVRRFHDVVNQRLVQFGRSQSIGALEPPAAQHLIQRPLEALGYRLDIASVNRILTLTQHQPSLIQLVCDELLKFLHERARGPHSPPYEVSRHDVDRVLAQPSLTREIVDRFELTVRLDDRYRVIALVVAYLAAENRMNATFEVEELWHQCQAWWPAGFTEQSRDTVFDALLEEMVGLGVLYMRQNRYGLYSPHVGRMLGTQEQIAGRLREAGRKPAPSRGFDGSALRLPLPPRRRVGQGGREPKGSRVSPLNLRQVALLQQPADDVHLIVGSRALGSGDLGDAMSQLVGDAEGVEVLPAKSALADEEEAKRFVGRVKVTARGMNRVAFAEAGPITADALFDVLDGAAKTVHLRTSKQRVSAVVSVDERGIGAWYELLVEGRDAELRLSSLELSRHTVDSLRVWAQRQDVDLPAFEKAEAAVEILGATGGWPILVDRVARDLLGHRNPKKALASLEAYLKGEGAMELLASCGVTAVPALERAFRFFVDIADQDLQAIDGVSMFADIAEVSEGEADAGWRVLRALDVLEISEADGTVRPEPVVAAAFSRR